MLQLTQKLKNGETKVLDVPWPQPGPSMILVRNHYSVISAGTEGATANSARKSLPAKAKERPEQVKQVWEVVRRSGPSAACRAVMKKLEAYSPCGYSSAGTVIAAGSRTDCFAPGDKVACAGVGYANHAEIVAVPVNLCVKLADDADLADAAYNTLGAIAMQGVRQADLRLGESALVIGLGLIGQLTAQLLRAAGIRVIGVDVSPRAVRQAEKFVDLPLRRDDDAVEAKIDAFTGGNGVDAVLIAAGASGLDPVNFAGRAARRKATVVVVGAVPTGFDRDVYYRKELALKMSCSYGPGRYDADYEEKGIDYPVEYVRWTERRNMEAFQQLLHAGKVEVKSLTTHRYAFERAPEAYDLIVNRSEPFTGILLEYDVTRECLRKPIVCRPPSAVPAGSIGVAFFGAGSYAQGNLLPVLPPGPEIRRVGILTATGTSSRRVAERFGFEFCTDREQELLENPDVNTVFIATRHDSHAEYVVKALQHGKNVFVEKPLVMNFGELRQVEEAYAAGSGRLLVGVNRRFAPLAVELKRAVGDGPMSMLYRVNAGRIAPASWIQDREFGGGRIIGECCHFIDFLGYVCGSLPVRIYAAALPDPHGLQDTADITVEFANGSTGTIAYYANGSKALPKEYFEVHHAGTSALLHDFRKLEIYGKKVKKHRLFTQDKGQKAMLKAFFDSIRNGDAPPIPFDELIASTRATLSAVQSIREKAPVDINGRC